MANSCRFEKFTNEDYDNLFKTDFRDLRRGKKAQSRDENEKEDIQK